MTSVTALATMITVELDRVTLRKLSQVRNRLDVRLKITTSTASTMSVAITGLPRWRATNVRTEVMMLGYYAPGCCGSTGPRWPDR